MPALDFAVGRNHPHFPGGLMSKAEGTMDRRTFLGKSAALTAGGAAFASTALSYRRIAGANDRISLCHIGNGRRGDPAQPERAGGHAASQRTSPQSCVRRGADRSFGPSEQGGSGLELPWPAVARTCGNEADSRRRYRLAQMAADQAPSPVRSASLLRISLVQGILERNPRPVDEPRDRHGALVLERQFSALGDGAWRDFCLA